MDVGQGHGRVTCDALREPALAEPLRVNLMCETSASRVKCASEPQSGCRKGQLSQRGWTEQKDRHTV